MDSTVERTARRGTRASPDEAAIGKLEARFRGDLRRPGDDQYETARKVWNGSIDRYPALIARCAGVADVMAAVEFARTNDLLVAVRGGAHSIPGFGTCDGGIVIDLSGMKGVRVDPGRRVARVQGGATWGDLDHETQAFGLAVTGGLISTTGIAGFTLGGGIGWLMRKYGLACDNLLSADVVTADGRFLTASAAENADLLWGLRGGGGNFGIVTSFEFRLHPVGPEVMAGLVFYPGDRARDVLRFYRDCAAAAPDELALLAVLRTAPAAPFLPEAVHGKPVVAIGACYAGPVADAEAVTSPLKRFGRPLADLVQPRLYTAFQRLLDASWTPGFQNYWKAEYLSGLDDRAIDTLADYAANISSPLSDIKIMRMGGAVSRVGEADTAVSHRHAALVLAISARWSDPSESDVHVGWARGLWQAMRPHSAGGVYVNFLSDEGGDRVRAAYGEETFGRLAALKRTYDPTNVFRLNQNIAPAA